MHPEISKSSLHRYCEPTWQSDLITMMQKSMRFYEVDSSVLSTGDVACYMAQFLGGFPQVYLAAGELPWGVGIYHNNVQVESIVDLRRIASEMPIPEGCLDRFTPIHFSKKQGWLIYYNEAFRITDCRTRYYFDAELHKGFDEFASSDSYGAYINEKKLMDFLISKSNSKSAWKTRMSHLRENSWVNSRVSWWINDFIMPSNWLTYGVGMAFQFLRWKKFFAGKENADVLAWETMWLGRDFSTKKLQ